MSKKLESLLELEEDTQKDRYLTFKMGNEGYGIDIKYVTEIIGLQPITEVPGLPDYIKGVINLRGKVIPVMDVRLRFKKKEIDYDDRTCIIVIDINELSIGLIVDRVTDVVSIQEDNISVPPNVGKNQQNRYISGIGKIGKEVKLLLDCEKLLKSEDVEEIEKTASGTQDAG